MARRLPSVWVRRALATHRQRRPTWPRRSLSQQQQKAVAATQQRSKAHRSLARPSASATVGRWFSVCVRLQQQGPLSRCHSDSSGIAAQPVRRHVPAAQSGLHASADSWLLAPMCWGGAPDSPQYKPQDSPPCLPTSSNGDEQCDDCSY